MPDVTFKVVIFGDGGVGKTALVNKYLTGVFKSDTRLTVGLDFHIKRLKIEKKEVVLQIWDFAGEDRFRYLLPTYVRGASGGIFMYDITRYSSLKHINDWFEALKVHDTPLQSEIPILLVGGKLDLEERRAVDCKEAYNLAKSLNLRGFIECSAKTGANVEPIFTNVTKIMMQKSELLKSKKPIEYFKTC